MLKIGTLTADPGEKISGKLKVVNSEVEIPITLICGAEEGETALICGGVHNAEYVGIQAAMEIADELDPAEISGNIVIVRLANPTGFEHRTMSLVYEDGKNLNRVFPGSALGTLADKIAYTFENEIYPHIDYFMDLHCGDGYEGLHPYVYCLGNASDRVCEVSRKMAEAVDVDYLVVSPVAKGGAYNYAGTLGIPAILLERGSRAIWSSEEVSEDKEDVRNVLRTLGILAGETNHCFDAPKEVKSVIYDDAPAAGCWYPNFKPGELFKKDDVLGVIRDYFGNELHTCRAKEDGVILYETVSLNIMKDGPMVAYGVL
ncbi:MAG: succinylglutamate desuccinylase/aspartoacylase family protein [Lachnospiraceae bacterium]|nr:succinylglutamate desuccinylase/aspartoacylase family protein [Lachnospiraceae bacterium]